MLFLYPASQEVSMWMKDTHVSLDMVFIKADGMVHRIEAATETALTGTVVPSRGDVVAVLSWPPALPGIWRSSPAIRWCIQPSPPASN